MLNPDIQMEVGKVGVVTSDNGGLTAEQLTEMCVNKIVYALSASILPSVFRTKLFTCCVTSAAWSGSN